MEKFKLMLAWVARLAAAVILLQTLYFKFSGAAESRYIFSTLGAEPWGRIVSGIMELIASVLLLIPQLTVYGALLGLAIMTGAILSHLFILGIEVQGDGGLLFFYAIIVFASCSYLVWINRIKIPVLNKFI
ncbi:MAG TPA: hypothetical protein VI548_14080 [Chitinophagaceae bacterium]|nr:hypothetical protein [Chitinophagaceae bacterium]